MNFSAPIPEIETVLDAHATIGESPVWCAAQQALYWVDIKKPALYRLIPTSGDQHCWAMSSDIGGFALLPDGWGAVVALREGLFKLEFASGNLSILAASPFDPSLFRFNETACDAAGRFWVGVMFDPITKGAERRKASLHSFTLQGGLRSEPDLSDLHNGMAWSSDGREFYLSHSYQQEIFVFPYEDGHLGARRSFARLPNTLGIPDGAAVDTEGGYWCACHGGGRLWRYKSDGSVDREIILPVSQPTMCAFAGERLDMLYVTSARDGLTPEQLRQEPLAGALLRLRPGEKGIVRPCTV